MFFSSVGIINGCWCFDKRLQNLATALAAKGFCKAVVQWAISLHANSLLPTKKFQREAAEWRIGDYLLIKTYNRLEKFQRESERWH
jgi:hypothetical protein